MLPQRIKHVSQLARQRHHRHLRTPSRGHLLGPLDHRIVRPMSVERPRGWSERPPYVGCAGASEPGRSGPEARRVLPRNQAQIGSHTGRLGKSIDIVQRGDESRRRHRTDARHGHQPARADVRPGQDFQLGIRLRDLFTERLEHDEDALKVRRQTFRVVDQGAPHLGGQRVGLARSRGPIRDRR
jgi:hypothetical protein